MVGFSFIRALHYLIPASRSCQSFNAAAATFAGSPLLPTTDALRMMGCPVGQQRQSLLYGKERAFHIDAKDAWPPLKQ